ncbi:hypothetical protein EV426DRAFT_720134 [Tirmania nivea]|nr:hypothetical protein EV426DRAFT_720134 [Tirmania nivea]
MSPSERCQPIPVQGMMHGSKKGGYPVGTIDTNTNVHLRAPDTPADAAADADTDGTGEEVMESGSIKWDRDYGKLLAYKLKDKYKTKYLCRTRIAVAKQ